MHVECNGELLEKNGQSTWKVFRLSYKASFPLHMTLCSWFKETLNVDYIKRLRNNDIYNSTTLKKVTELPVGDCSQESTLLFEALPLCDIQEILD